MFEKIKKSQSYKQFHLEPFLWAAFGQGGTIGAICFPILILLFGLLMVMGVYEPTTVYQNALVLYDNFLGKIIIFTILAFNLWHASHRIYHATHDFKFHPPLWIKLSIYGVAALGSLVIFILLI